MDELHDYEFFFGTRGGNVLRDGELIPVRPWHLRHVTDFSTEIDTSTVEIGIPNEPPTMVQIFQTQGATRNFTITGIRLDGEEQISNQQFIFGNISDTYHYDDMINAPYKACSVGIRSLMSVIQSGVQRYVLIIRRRNEGEVDEREENLPTGVYRVAIERLTVNFLQTLGGIEYSISMVAASDLSNTPYVEIHGD